MLEHELNFNLCIFAKKDIFTFKCSWVYLQMIDKIYLGPEITLQHQ